MWSSDLDKRIKDVLSREMEEATQGLEGCAEFLRVHADEERGHMMRLFDYVNEAGGMAQLGVQRVTFGNTGVRCAVDVLAAWDCTGTRGVESSLSVAGPA